MVDYEDGAYYEVQLNNKQLVFFFMATLAIAVVVFLCGVMVGRGVRDATLAAAQNDITAGTLSQSPEAQPPATVAKTELDYPDRLESDKVQNKLQPIRSESPETTVRSKPKASPPAATATKPKPKATPPPKPSRSASTLGRREGAFTIQVVALKTQGAAESLLQKLRKKHYRAYLEAQGDAGLHRVRVGRFPTRAEAERVVAKLRTEEKFKPYITQ